MNRSISAHDHHQTHIRVYIVLMIITFGLISFDVSSQTYRPRKVKHSFDDKKSKHSMSIQKPKQQLNRQIIDTIEPFDFAKNKTTHYKVGDMRKLTKEK